MKFNKFDAAMESYNLCAFPGYEKYLIKCATKKDYFVLPPFAGSEEPSEFVRDLSDVSHFLGERELTKFSSFGQSLVYYARHERVWYEEFIMFYLQVNNFINGGYEGTFGDYKEKNRFEIEEDYVNLRFDYGNTLAPLDYHVRNAAYLFFFVVPESDILDKMTRTRLFVAIEYLRSDRSLSSDNDLFHEIMNTDEKDVVTLNEANKKFRVLIDNVENSGFDSDMWPPGIISVTGLETLKKSAMFGKALRQLEGNRLSVRQIILLRGLLRTPELFVSSGDREEAEGFRSKIIGNGLLYRFLKVADVFFEDNANFDNGGMPYIFDWMEVMLSGAPSTFAGKALTLSHGDFMTSVQQGYLRGSGSKRFS